MIKSELEININHTCDGDLIKINSIKYPLLKRYIKNHFHYNASKDKVDYDFEVRKPEYYNNSHIIDGYNELNRKENKDGAFDTAKQEIIAENYILKSHLNKINKVDGWFFSDYLNLFKFLNDLFDFNYLSDDSTHRDSSKFQINTLSLNKKELVATLRFTTEFALIELNDSRKGYYDRDGEFEDSFSSTFIFDFESKKGIVVGEEDEELKSDVSVKILKLIINNLIKKNEY